MDDKARGGKKKAQGLTARALGAVSLTVLVALLCGAVLLAAVLLDREDDHAASFQVTGEETVAPLIAVNSSDYGVLRDAFGGALPVLEGESGEGQARNGTFDGRTARLVSYRCGALQVSAVRPAAAAPLIRPEGYVTVLRKDVTVLRAPALLSRGASGYAACFTYDGASYAVTGEGMDEETFTALLGRMHKLP